MAVFLSWMPSHSITAVWLLGPNNLNQHYTSYYLFSHKESMFEGVGYFNHALSDWDVSKGESFVSDDKALQLLNLLRLVLAVFRSWMLSYSITAL
jgi:hypothetical protein